MRTVLVYDEDVLPDRVIIWRGGTRFDIHTLYVDDDEISIVNDETIGVQNLDSEPDVGAVVKFAEEIIDRIQAGDIDVDHWTD